mgnify:CR=1 FL=1
MEATFRSFVMLAKSFKRFTQNLADDYFGEKYFQISQYAEAVKKVRTWRVFWVCTIIRIKW